MTDATAVVHIHVLDSHKPIYLLHVMSYVNVRNAELAHCRPACVMHEMVQHQIPFISLLFRFEKAVNNGQPFYIDHGLLNGRLINM